MSLNELSKDVVAERLRALQSHYGSTLQEMADRCGLPKRSLENYMRSKNPQRPGLDALVSMANGFEVSVDWLVGRSNERHAPEFTTEAYALFCHSVVLRLLDELIHIAAEDPQAFDQNRRTIAGRDFADIAAWAMLEFFEVVNVQRGNAKRPHGYFQDRFQDASDRAKRNAITRSVSDLLGRKP